MKPKKKISKTFIGFLLAALLMWFLITLSKPYDIAIDVPITYTNLPNNKLLLKATSKTINIAVNGTGFKLLKLKYNTKALQINASILTKKQNQTYFLKPQLLTQFVEKQLASGISLKRINTDSLFLDISTLASKKIPVTHNMIVNFNIGYGLQEPLKMAPDSITVSGPASILDTLDVLPLDPLELSNVTANFKKSIGFNLKNASKDLQFSHKTITVTGKVTKFTEGKLTVPFRIINLPENMQLNTLAKDVEVVFVVGLDNFNSITNTSFTIICDYMLSKKNNLSYLVPKLINAPNAIKSYKIIPDKIDFLIVE